MEYLKEINLYLLDIPSGFDVFLFGSILKSKDFRDIDIALIYDEDSIDIKSAIEYRRLLKKRLELVYKKIVDIVLLSQSENIETMFIINAKAIKIKTN